MSKLIKLIALFVIILILGAICSLGDHVYSSIGLFGPVLLIGALIWFFSNAFRNN